MDPSMQRESGCVVGRDYPAPIVDHANARRRALSRYR
jgi:deoxyribodipyrimidine photolyase